MTELSYKQVATPEQIKQWNSEGYNQVCIWPGCYLPDGTSPKDFEDKMNKQILPGIKVKYLEEVTTLPDVDEQGKAIPGTGGRTDLFFLMHDESVGKYAVQRLQCGIRWLEDVVKYNPGAHLYNQSILEKYPARW